MLRITRQTDIGIVVLTLIAGRPAEEFHAARDLAGRSGISTPMVSKILKQLSRGGLVESIRGAHGGYRLTRPAADITVGEIIEALEGRIGMTSCVVEPGSCEIEGACPTQVNWGRISAAVRSALDRVPLTDMIGPRSPVSPTRRERRLIPLAG